MLGGKMFENLNEDYVITECLNVGDTIYALGENENATQKFVVWKYSITATAGKANIWGHYCNNRMDGLEYLCRRTIEAVRANTIAPSPSNLAEYLKEQWLQEKNIPNHSKNEINAGYTITDRLIVGNSEFVIGQREKAPANYVTWKCRKGEKNYYWGHYLNDRLLALEDLCKRALEEIEHSQGLKPYQSYETQILRRNRQER